ncbi:MAG: hypothetical protein ACI9LM_005378 [Alteromonadaceae bacterium]|jgi:hypothetical protein
MIVTIIIISMIDKKRIDSMIQNLKVNLPLW